MPMYEYQCNKCQSRFEELCSHDAPPPKCPWCRSDDTRRLMSAATAMYGSAERRANMHGLGVTGKGGGNCGSGGGRFS